jgi:hypothetical protein
MVVIAIRAFHRISRGDRRIGALLLITFTGVFVERFVSDALGKPDLQQGAHLMEKSQEEHVKILGHPLLSLAEGKLPLVIGNPFWVPVVAHYAPPAMAARIYYLSDARASERFAGTDYFEAALPIMYRLPVPGHIVNYRDFVAAHHRFLVYSSGSSYDWIMGRLGEEKDITFTFIGRFNDSLLLEASLPDLPLAGLKTARDRQ